MESKLFSHPYLICVDSDGCVFDAMEIKHKECFCPAYIEHFGLQTVSKYARDAWEFVNLYSCYRGIHRLLALLKALDVLAQRREVIQREFSVPQLPELRRYVAEGQPLNNEGLQMYLEEHPEANEIRVTLAWSHDVNERIGHMVHGIPPFPHVRESLQSLSEKADILIVSATPRQALEREWAEQGMIGMVSQICGQESGSKKEIIHALCGKYPPEHVLMIGDAPGDLNAAMANDALFYPICPDKEVESWAKFIDYIPSFWNERYQAEHQSRLIARFEAVLPDTPMWQRGREI